MTRLTVFTLTITRTSIFASALAIAMALPIWSSPAVAEDDVRVSSEDGGDTAVLRYYDQKTGKLTKVVRETETDDPNDRTKIWKKVATKTYDQGKRPPYKIEVDEQEIVLVKKNGPHPKRVVRKQTKTLTTYTKTGEREPVVEVEEEMELVGLDAKGKPIYEGTRVTTRRKGVIPEKNEVWDAKAGEWMVLPAGVTLDQILEAQPPDRGQLPSREVPADGFQVGFADRSRWR